ncbi:MAG TPA: hybrid sensor histidine kinase/response regulator [Chloroflexota bacterium]|nr:hybrid sensor histidine kinase/response regulator [Chloroflexota bacterium]HUM68650.1 hybrid sensor histidine kinase/response regulator [Chloroflexota bacterium]
MVKARVLYIEDDLASQRLVNRLLSSSGYEVLTASDGIEGVVLAQKAHPNLILMDINLPQMDGRALTTRLRSSPHFSDTPIVALTAHRDADNRNLALAAGCTGFMTKPIDVDTFPQQIESFLKGQRQKLSAQEHQLHLERHTQELVRQLEAKMRELEEANRRMQELNQLKSDFLAMASHDLQAPLMVTGQQLRELETLLDGAPEQTAVVAHQNLVQRMKGGLNRMHRVASEIDQVAKIMSGLLKLEFKLVNLGDVVADVVGEMTGVCAARQMHLYVSSLSHLPPVWGDEGQLRTAVANIVGNAIKFTPDGGHVYITAESSHQEIRLSVQDTGLGIPREEQGYIFDLFYALGSVQNHSTSKSAFCGGGLGLGLPMAKGIIEAHNGRILLESDPQTLPGSTFTICLPV